MHKDYRGQGLSKVLLKALIERAKQHEIHMLIGAIDHQNTVSLHLHQSFGFYCVGTFKEVGYKFGTWLDVDFYQLTLLSNFVLKDV